MISNSKHPHVPINLALKIVICNVSKYIQVHKIKLASLKVNALKKKTTNAPSLALEMVLPILERTKVILLQNQNILAMIIFVRLLNCIFRNGLNVKVAVSCV